MHSVQFTFLNCERSKTSNWLLSGLLRYNQHAGYQQEALNPGQEETRAPGPELSMTQHEIEEVSAIAKGACLKKQASCHLHKGMGLSGNFMSLLY